MIIALLHCILKEREDDTAGRMDDTAGTYLESLAG